jgi:uncharacterized repeat protein (TIGR01451 family)
MNTLLFGSECIFAGNPKQASCVCTSFNPVAQALQGARRSRPARTEWLVLGPWVKSAALVCALSSGLYAANTIPVTTTADTGPDSPTPGSLRAALAAAADGDTIDATGVTGTITLVGGQTLSAELVVDKSVTILGPGPTILTVDANHLSRIFHITPGQTVTIDGLRIVNGHIGDTSTVGHGGGIYNDHASLTVNNCVLAQNFARDLGGAIFNDGAGPYPAGSGGALGTAELVVLGSTLWANSSWYGSALYNSAVSDGTATATLLATTLLDNATYANSTAQGVGGIYNDAFLNGNATLSLIRSTLSGNRPIGIVNDQGRADITTSTLDGNNGVVDVGGGQTVQVGVDNWSGLLRVANSTLVNTSIRTLNSAATEVGNTILQSDSLLDPAIFSFGTVISHGFNLCNDNGSGLLTAMGDQILKDPLLGPLLDNGGPTLTHAPLAGSPAIDRGRADTIGDLVSGTDQRGLPRTVDDPSIPNAPSSDATDIGAVEVAVPNHPPVAKCKDVTALADASGTASASINDGSFDPDAGDAITVVQTPPGPYPIGSTAVTLTVTDTHGASSSCTATVTVQAVSDLAISVSAVSGQDKPGQVIVYTIMVSNQGPNPASSVVVNDAVPQGTTFTSASPAPASAPPVGAAGTVTWNLGNLASGARATLTLKVSVGLKGNNLIVDTATVGCVSFDPNSANNSATITTKRNTK